MSHMGDINVEQQPHPNGFSLVGFKKIFAGHQGDTHPEKATTSTSRGLPADVTGGSNATTSRVGHQGDVMADAGAIPRSLGPPRDVMVK